MKPKSSRKPEQRAIRLPKFFCAYCKEPVDPTEDSLRRILTKGVQNACPFYICPCTPTELQVHPGWHKVQLEPR